MTAGLSPAGVGPPGGLLASTAAVTAGNLASRVTGFVRVLVVGLVLGTTFVGNTYQSANLVSNILFELTAAGLMSTVLVPPLVRLLSRGDREQALSLAGSVLGLALVVLGVLTAAALLARPWLMRALTVAVEDPEVRRQEVALGSFLLVFFLPQVLLYAVGAVTTGLLHGQRRFAAAAFAPVANNVTVIATMAAFWAVGGGGRPGLDLSGPERWVLGAGTTLGVLVMTAVPVVAARRAGLALRPRWDLRQAGLGRLGRDGLWAAATLGLTQVLVVTTLVLANRIEGGVVAYHIAFQLFLLPFALLAHPVVTALFPRLASAAQSGDASQFGDQLRGGAAALAFLVLPASAVAAALAEPALGLLRLGNLDAAGVEMAGRLVAAYAVGLMGYAGFQLLLRACYATGDMRAPAVAAAAIAVGGSATMVLWFTVATGDGRLAAVGYGHSAAYLGGALALAAVLHRRLAASGPVAPLLWAMARSAACAGVAGVVAFMTSRAWPAGEGATAGGVASLVLAGLLATGAYAGAQRALGAPEMAWLRGRRSGP
jgi:putative peptidoglycan lipid II flippase